MGSETNNDMAESNNDMKKTAKQAVKNGQLDMIDLIKWVLIAVACAAVVFYAIVAATTIKPVDKVTGGNVQTAQNQQAGENGKDEQASPEGQKQEGVMPSADAGQESQEAPSDDAVSQNAGQTSDNVQGNQAEGTHGDFYGVPADNAVAESVHEANLMNISLAYIHDLPDDVLYTIRATLSDTVEGFGLGLGQKEMNEYNRPVQMEELNDRFIEAGVNARVFCGDENTPAAALSFQAGYDNGYTEKVLDILKEYGVYATFYITHEFAKNNEELVKRMINDGHEIGSHSYSCPDSGIAYLSLEEQKEDALKMQDYMRNTFFYNMRKYNYNSGYWSMQSAAMMTQMGYEVCFASVNYADFDPSVSFDKDEVLKDMESKAHNGVVYCFHMTNEITVEILPSLIEYLRSQGYTIWQLD